MKSVTTALLFLLAAIGTASASVASDVERPDTPEAVCDLFEPGIRNFNSLMPTQLNKDVRMLSASSQVIKGEHCLITIQAEIPGDRVVGYAEKNSDLPAGLIRNLLKTRMGQRRLHEEVLSGIRLNFMRNPSFAKMFRASRENLALGVHVAFPSKDMTITEMRATFRYQDYLAVQPHARAR